VNDGVVDIHDLDIVYNNFGIENPEYPKVDVNNDGDVNILDLLIVALHYGESCIGSAPMKSTSLPRKHLNSVERWLTEARLVDDGSYVFRIGINTLEGLLSSVIPEKTVLLPNFPNPFNPETWIPYDLAQNANVHIEIYDLKGEIIRKLNLGYQEVGTYRTKERAAYWDGRNSIGEFVASGVYFCSLNTGKLKVIRQMVIHR